MLVSEVIEVIERVSANLQHEVGKKKLLSVLSKNSGYSQLKTVAEAVDTGKEIPENTPVVAHWSFEELALARKAPMISCDVERSFSKYNSLLCDNRTSLQDETIKKLLFLSCNTL